MIACWLLLHKVCLLLRIRNKLSSHLKVWIGTNCTARIRNAGTSKYRILVIILSHRKGTVVSCFITLMY